MPDPGSTKGVIFLPPTDFAVERVFPIRHLVGDTGEASQQDRLQDGPQDGLPQVTETAGGDGFPSGSLGQPATDGGLNAVEDANQEEATPKPTHLPPPYPNIPPDDAIRKLPQPEYELSGLSDGEGQRRRLTERTKLIPTTSGAPDVLSGIISDRTSQTFQRCEDEPIHTPGAVQQYGVLLALRFNDDEDRDLEVRIVSENSRMLLGYGPEQLFRLKSFLNILDAETREDALGRIKNALALRHDNSSSEKTEDTQLDVFAATVISPSGSQIKLWCALHIANGSQDLMILEFEPYTEVLCLSEVDYEKTIPEKPVTTVDIEIAPEEKQKSTSAKSTPLRILEIARQKKQTGVSSMDIFNAMAQAQQQLASTRTLGQVMDLVVGIIAELTGFHRVMFYRFDAQKNGCVEAELVNPLASVDLFRGLHFPASDIPKQARALYIVNRIRILYDRDEETARLVCRDTTDFEVPLDLTHSYLRAMSPIHLKYLGNMGVRSSMSVSVVINSDLWGLIACHGYGDLGLRVTLPIRELCRNIGECAAANIERLLMLQRIEARKPPTTTPPAQNPAGFIAASSADLLRAFGADFGLLSIEDEARAIGKLEPYREALAVLAHLQKNRFTTVHACQNINAKFPDINYHPGIRSLAGLLVIPLSKFGNDFLVFFRRAELQEVRWAGNPYEKILKNGGDYLEPRKSFERWTETVVGMSTEWTEDQLETASILSLLYGRFIEIWRQKESAGQSNRMSRLLIQNAAHEVRTPLNAIINYLEMALENKIDDGMREILGKASTASKSLVYVINDLLSLTKIEHGVTTSPEDAFNLVGTILETLGSFKHEAIRKGLELTVSTHQGLPEMVKGDQARLRQVLSNLTSNAFQHSAEGGIKVEIRPILTKGNTSIIGITVQDLGAGMSENQLDDLFLEFEQVTDQEVKPDTPTPSNSTVVNSLGLGLAVVARYVKNMKGQIRVHSELGKGTIFGIELPFEHAMATPTTPQILSPVPRNASATRDIHSRILHPVREAEFKQTDFAIVTDESLTSSTDSQAENIATPEGHSGTMSSRSSTDPSGTTFPFPQMDGEFQGDRLSVLIAEDNPVNARVLTRRLQKLGHEVGLALDGQQCHDYFALNPHAVDVILMDLQMPLVDGASSTKMIRQHERELVDELRRVRPRVPIIAVSASLAEDKRFEYVQSGFDAWLLKPIDVERLSLLLRGVKLPEFRRHALYTPGCWESGGWFLA